MKIMKPTGDGHSLLITAQVKRFDAEHVAPLEEFEIDFPAGTLIHDLRAKDKTCIVIDRSNNEKLLTPREHRLTIDEILHLTSPP